MTDPASDTDAQRPAPPDPAEVAAQVRAEMTGPGGPWETAIEDVLGQPLLVFANRHRSLRDAFIADTTAHADTECLVLGDTRLTYAEVADRVAACAQRLADEFGVGHGDRVAILAAQPARMGHHLLRHRQPWRHRQRHQRLVDRRRDRPCHRAHRADAARRRRPPHRSCGIAARHRHRRRHG